MTAPLSDAAVRASVARAEAATPGPWTVQAENGHSAVIWARGRPETSPKLAIFYGNAKDAEFAAAARTDVVALGNEVLRLRETLWNVLALPVLNPISNFGGRSRAVLRHARAALPTADKGE